jgi:hypothetical protein
MALLTLACCEATPLSSSRPQLLFVSPDGRVGRGVRLLPHAVGRIGLARAAYATVLFPLVALATSTAFEGYRWTVFAAAASLSNAEKQPPDNENRYED